MTTRRQSAQSTARIRPVAAARIHCAPTVVAFWCLLNVAATGRQAATDNPFNTPAEKAATAAAAAASPADDPFATPEERGVASPTLLMNRQPLDIVVLKERPPREEEILPLGPAQRKVLTAGDANVLLRVRLRSDPHSEYFLSPRDVVEVRFFENRVLQEGSDLAKRGRFDDAFEVFTFLRRSFPTLVGLAEAEQEYILLEARHEIAQKRWESALALAWRLNELQPRHARLVDILPPAIEGSIAERMLQNNPTAARRGVEQLAVLFPVHPVTTRLQKRLGDEVAARLDEARNSAAKQDWAQVQTALNTALALAPGNQPAQTLFAEAVAKHPRVIVGVGAAPARSGAANAVEASEHRSSYGDDWSQRRIARLIAPPALELAATTDGASLEYRSGWARWTTNPRDDALHELQVPAGSTYRTAAALLAAANPSSANFRPAWHERQVRIAVRDDDHIDLDFAKRHPRTEALAAAVLEDAVAAGLIAEPIHATYESRPAVSETTRFIRTPRPQANAAAAETQPVEIVERSFPDEEAAVAALRFGEIDVVDRIAPWHLAELRETREVRLMRYIPLSVHCLCVRSRHPLLAKQEFRRALLYSLDRDGILRDHLHIADATDGSRTARGVFSSGRSPEDPLGYANNPALVPRPYDPQAAFILARLAMPPEAAAALRSRPLVLAHPATAVAARACEQIRLQWSRIGVAIELRAVSEAASVDEADLVYTVVAAPEPLIDAERLFGPGGITSISERALAGPLRQLADSTSFAEARAALFEIQRVVHEQTLVLPLWQLNEYAAARTRVAMSTTPPLTLYQFVDQWRAAAGINEPLP